MRRTILSAAAMWFVCVGVRPGAAPTTLVVVELFTSEGCSDPLDAAWQRDRLAIVAFVQEQRRHTILASAAVPMKIARP